MQALALYPSRKIFSVEKDEKQIKMLKENIKNLKCFNIEVIEGEATVQSSHNFHLQTGFL